MTAEPSTSKWFADISDSLHTTRGENCSYFMALGAILVALPDESKPGIRRRLEIIRPNPPGNLSEQSKARYQQMIDAFIEALDLPT